MLGAVVPVYNIPGVSAELKFTGPVLADIFLGKITKWNDPAIAKLNPGVKLPATDITVVHRSDGSGTTYIWVDYLSKVSPEWKKKVGVATSVNWPVGVGGKGNEGVSGLVKQTPGSIGYVELIYALQNKISYGSVQNTAGEFVKASVESVTAAAAAAAAKRCRRTSACRSPTRRARASIRSRRSPGCCSTRTRRTRRRPRSMVDFMKWALTDGQKFAPTSATRRCRTAVVKLEMAALAQDQGLTVDSWQTRRTVRGSAAISASGWAPALFALVIC